MKKLLLLIIVSLLPLCSWAENQGYAVFDESTGTLTFKYGDPDMDSNIGSSNEIFLEGAAVWDRTKLKKVVFNSTFSNVRPTSTECWFQWATSLTEIVGLQYLNTSEVTSMNAMFDGCSNLESLDLSHFDTSNVTDMYGMFGGCCNLTSLDLSSFNTNNVTNMDWMFGNCNNLVRIYVGNLWNTAKVTIGDGMFYGCKKLVGGKGMRYEESELEEPYYTDQSYAHIDSQSSPGFLTDINDKAALEPLGATESFAVFDAATGTLTFKCGDKPAGDNVFDVSNTTDRSWEFKSAMWDISKVKKVVFEPTFANARPKSTAYWFFDYDDNPNLTEITGLQYLNTSSVTDMGYMFYSLTNLKSLDLSHFDTRNVTNMEGMFGHCSSLTSLDVTGFNTSKVQNMGVMFDSCSGLTSLDVSHFDTSNVRGMGQMFSGCSSLKSLDISHFNTSNVTSMIVMFENCSSLTSIDVSHFDTGNVTDMGQMFSGCSSLKSLDVSNFNTTNVVWMPGMFSGCSNLTSLDLSSFNTSKVENMNYMFYNCKGLTSLDLSSFDTGHLSVPRYEDEKESDDTWGTISMFEGCTGLTILDLSSFDTSTVEHMLNMFTGCSNLKTIYVGDKWSTDNIEIKQTPFYTVDGHQVLFTGCEKLVGGKGTKFNANYSYDTFARIDGGVGAPGYFTAAYMKEGVSYIYEGDGSMAVRDVSGSRKEVEIPSSLDISGEVHTVKVIQPEAFMDNDNMKVVSIPESIEEIGENAFAGCSDLTTIYCHTDEPIALPSTKANIRTRAGNQESTTNVFTGVDKVICLLYVPAGSVSKYKAANGWKDFKYIVGIGTEFVIGDVNGDKALDKKDLNAIVNHIMDKPQEGKFDKDMADINKDGEVNAADVVEAGKLTEKMSN